MIEQDIATTETPTNQKIGKEAGEIVKALHEVYRDSDCSIEYNEKEKKVEIKNLIEGGLYKISDVKSIKNNGSKIIIIKEDNGKLEIDVKKDNKLIIIEYSNLNDDFETILISKEKDNKKNTKYLRFKGHNTFRREKLIEVFTDKDNSAIYNEDLNNLGTVTRMRDESDNECHNLGIVCIKGNNAGEFRVLSTKDGKEYSYNYDETKNTINVNVPGKGHITLHLK